MLIDPVNLQIALGCPAGGSDKDLPVGDGRYRELDGVAYRLIGGGNAGAGSALPVSSEQAGQRRRIQSPQIGWAPGFAAGRATGGSPNRCPVLRIAPGVHLP